MGKRDCDSVVIGFRVKSLADGYVRYLGWGYKYWMRGDSRIFLYKSRRAAMWSAISSSVDEPIIVRVFRRNVCSKCGKKR